MSQASTFWDKVADKYAKRPITDEATYQKKLGLTRKYFTNDSSVLEFGCGTGSTALLHAPYVKNIISTDVSTRMIEIANQKLRDSSIKNIEFRCATLFDPSLDDQVFDVVLGLNVLHLMADYQQAIERAYALLKPGGVFVTSTGCLGSSLLFKLLIPPMILLGKAPQVQFFYPQDVEKNMEKAGFTIIEKLTQKNGLFLIVKK